MSEWTVEPTQSLLRSEIAVLKDFSKFKECINAEFL